jgi:transcriptional/translational regulatory protein YebC/TACO1
MCYGENGTVKFVETLADNVFRHNYSMMQILKKLNDGKILG